MAEVSEVNELTMNSHSEEDSYTYYSSEMKDDTKDSTYSTDSEYRSPINMGGEYNEFEIIDEDGQLLKPILLNEELFEMQSVLESTSIFINATVRIRDSRQKCLTLQQQEGAHLVALFLQGNNLSKEATMNMTALKSTLLKGPTHQVTLSILGHNFYLSCISDHDTPVLSLTEVTDIENKEEKDLLPFLFRRSANTNNGKNTFESVAFPGWYICTSQAEQQLVQIKPQSDQEHIRDFLLYDPK